MDVNLSVAHMIKFYREKANVTQADLAETIGISRPSIVSMEQGKQNITVARLYDISIALNVPVSALFVTSKAHEELNDIEENYNKQIELWRQKHTSTE